MQIRDWLCVGLVGATELVKSAIEQAGLRGVVVAPLK